MIEYTDMKFVPGDLCITTVLFSCFKREANTKPYRDAKNKFINVSIPVGTIVEIISESTRDNFVWFPTLNFFGYVCNIMLKHCNDKH